MQLLWRIAVFCAAFPMGAGLLIFFGWLLGGARWLQWAGLIDIAAGILLFPVGVGCLVGYARSAGKQGKAWGERVSVLCVALVANFPLAFLLVAAAMQIGSITKLMIDNRSEDPVFDIVISEFGQTYPIGNLGASRDRTQRVRIKNEGELRFSLEHRGRIRSGTLAGYVSRSTGGSFTLIVRNDGEIEVCWEERCSVAQEPIISPEPVLNPDA